VLKKDVERLVIQCNLDLLMGWIHSQNTDFNTAKNRFLLLKARNAAEACLMEQY